MNDSSLKELLKRDTSVPKAPKDELAQIHQKIEKQRVWIFDLLNLRSLAMALSLVLVITGVSVTFNNDLPESTLTEIEQQELIEFMLEDAYLHNGESSYAWVEASN